jgi:hypothetical protein
MESKIPFYGLLFVFAYAMMGYRHVRNRPALHRDRHPQEAPMLSPRYQTMVFNAIMTFLMVLMMTAIATYINTGADAGYIARWLKAFFIAWPIAFVAVNVMGPLARRLTALVISPTEPTGKAVHEDA